MDWIFAILRRNTDFNFDYKRVELLTNPQYLLKMWITDKFCPSWPPGYVTAERFERVNNIVSNSVVFFYYIYTWCF